MGQLQSGLFVIFKEMQAQDRPYLDLDNPIGYQIFMRVLRIMECHHITLDREQQSRLLARIEYVNYLQKNTPKNEDERLLKNYFMQCDKDAYAVI